MGLHGAALISPGDIQAAIGLGILKIDVESVLKQAAFETIRRASMSIEGDDYDPYEVIGSGLKDDVPMAGRLMCRKR